MKLRIISAIMLVSILFLTATSCGEKVAYYKSDIPVTELCTAADAALSDSSTMALMDADYIKGMMDIDVSSFEEYAVKLQASGANVNEYGIFKAPADDMVESVREMAVKYLDLRVSSWMPEYMPEEFPKVKNATVKVMGRYIVYCILSDEDKANVFTAIDNILLGK